MLRIATHDRANERGNDDPTSRAAAHPGERRRYGLTANAIDWLGMVSADTPEHAVVVLMVETDPSHAPPLPDSVAPRGAKIARARSSADAETMFEVLRPDIVILNVSQVTPDDLFLCAKLRRRSDTPIIIVASSRRRGDVYLALKLGVDDFVAGQVEDEELHARIEARLRRGQRAAPEIPREVPGGEVLRLGNLTIDEAHWKVSVGDVPVRLTPIEYRLLLTLVRRAGEAVSREELAREVWGTKVGDSRTVDVHVSRLRLKLHEAGPSAPAIVAVRGTGYELTRSQDLDTPAA